jgi:hypothetical protein
MTIEHDTCQAVLNSAMADHENKFDFVHAMKDSMEERGHEELFFMVASLAEAMFDLDEDEGDEEAIQRRLNIHYTIVANGLLIYTAMLAAVEADQLNR